MKNVFLKYQEVIRYLVVGVLTTLVSLVIYYILVNTLLNPNSAFEFVMLYLPMLQIGSMFFRASK